MTARVVYGANWTLIAAYAAGAMAFWPRVPSRIPMHFGFTGAADAWADATLAGWLLLPGVALATGLLVAGLGWLAARSPETWNVPEKDRFLRLSDEARRPIVDSLGVYLGGVSVAVTVLFMAIHWGVYTTAIGRTAGLPRTVQALLLGLLIGTVAGAVLLNRRIKRQILEATLRDEGGGGPDPEER